MTKNPHAHLSRRERQIMDVIYGRDRPTPADVREATPLPPSYSAVRAMLRLLEEKGYLRHEQDGPRYVFLPTLSRERARQSAMKQLLQTFFDNSAEQAVAALLDMSRPPLHDAELDPLSEMIARARKEGR